MTAFQSESHLPPPCYGTEYGLFVESVFITTHARQVRIEYVHSNMPGVLTLDCPRPLESIAGLFADLYKIKVYDLNVTGASLNFGRYEVHLYDEDSAQEKFVCDRYTAE